MYLRGIKHALDLLLAVLLLVILSPAFVVIAFLIRVTSKGPALFRQQRVGRNEKLFTCYKFRTMRLDTPNLSTAELTALGIDPYTSIGPLLRNTSLDELPQLFNILKGEMSFIGPRPALPSQVDVNTLRERNGVHRLRPGITGLAQVMGRDDLDTESKVCYDHEYCRNVSFLFDARVLTLTVLAVVSAKGNK